MYLQDTCMLWCSFICFTFFVVWCAASPSTAHSRLEQLIIPALRMPIQEIKSSNLAPDNGYPNLGISGVSSVRPDNHWTSEGFNRQLAPLCYMAGNDRCTCATRHMEQPADAGLLPAALGSTRTYDADDCTVTTRNKFPSHLSSRLPSVQRRSESSFGLKEGPWDCGLTACDQSVTLL